MRGEGVAADRVRRDEAPRDRMGARPEVQGVVQDKPQFPIGQAPDPEDLIFKKTYYNFPHCPAKSPAFAWCGLGVYVEPGPRGGGLGMTGLKKDFFGIAARLDLEATRTETYATQKRVYFGRLC